MSTGSVTPRSCTPETWTPESCEPYFPELYAAPDAEGSVELELEDPLFTYEVPCSLANIAGASGATYWNERFGTVRLWHAPESAL